ncbi:MAG: class I SAM-dependent methyltransferase [Candidatus Eisenbacteria bacterium]|uniref:Class I SAM-dependent methyltransferase n=1 Tax=Eiseniibacteriota bacterium TaxID=2212470 RepID=A0A956LZD1_UNCEI|nr:class I SAM-dependent methyltransferase [Candidatus Eisenbacteria bacterium]
MSRDRHQLRRDSFDSVAEAYHEARPGYPEPLVDELVSLADIRTGTRVLEIGPGTGQLSGPLAMRGPRLTAVERGSRLADVARRALSHFPQVEVVTADFDHWVTTPGSFDVVVAATSFHWLDPSTRLERCARLLRPGGWLAIVQTRWGVARGEDPFFAASQACYARWDPSHDPARGQVGPGDVVAPLDELKGPDFGDVIHRRFLCERRHDAASYCGLLGTFSDILVLEETRRAGLLGCLSKLIVDRFGGRIVRHDLYDLCLVPRITAERDDARASAWPFLAHAASTTVEERGRTETECQE